MGLSHSTCLTSDSFDPHTASATDVRFGFVVHLPFRLRVGTWYRDSVVAQNRHFTFWLLNRIPIASGKPAGLQLPPEKSFSDLWTEALLVLEDPAVSEESLKPLRESLPGATNQNYPRPSGEMFHAMEALNHFIIGYATATKQLLGGAPLRVFRTIDFFDFLRWDVTILGSRNEAITDETARMIFDLRPDREVRAIGSITGDIDDLPTDMLAQIHKAIDLHQDFIFYEYSFEAKSKMVAGDYVGALLMAVAALEGVHAAYVHQALASKLPPDADASLPDDFLRELGMTLCNQLTPYIFMEVDQRPSADLIGQAERAIKFRNEIMHSLRNRRGMYRTRTRTNRELSEAYSAVLKLYECYRSAFEQHAYPEGA